MGLIYHSADKVSANFAAEIKAKWSVANESHMGYNVAFIFYRCFDNGATAENQVCEDAFGMARCRRCRKNDRPHGGGREGTQLVVEATFAVVRTLAYPSDAVQVEVDKPEVLGQRPLCAAQGRHRTLRQHPAHRPHRDEPRRDIAVRAGRPRVLCKRPDAHHDLPQTPLPPSFARNNTGLETRA